MSCAPTVIQLFPPCPPVCPETQELTFENANLAGEGVFFQKVDTIVSFFGIANTDGTIEVTLDATNKVVNLDLNPELLAGNFPDATTTSKGKVELAIDAEAVAKTSTTVVLTPSNLAALGGTTSFAGFLELATLAEAQAGTSTTLAVTPESLAAVVAPALRMGFANATSDDTTFDFSGAKFELTAGAGLYRFSNSGVRIEGHQLDLAAGGDLNFNGAKVQLAGTNVPANSFLTTTATAGVPGSILQSNVFILGSESNELPSDTQVEVGAFQLLFLDGGSSFATFSSSGILVEDHPIVMGSGSHVNFDGGDIQIAGVQIPADSFVRTDSGGFPTSELCALYFGPTTTTNTWFCPAFVADRDIDPATCTLTELATAFNTLLSDLASVIKPVVSIV